MPINYDIEYPALLARYASLKRYSDKQMVEVARAKSELKRAFMAGVKKDPMIHSQEAWEQYVSSRAEQEVEKEKP